MAAPPGEARPPIGLRGAPIDVVDAPIGLRDAPKDLVDPPKNEKDAPKVAALAPKAATPKALTAAPISLADYRARSHPAGVSPAAFRAFITRPDIRKMVLGIVKKRARPQSEEDLAAGRCSRRRRSARSGRSPPARDEVLVDWLQDDRAADRRGLREEAEATRPGKYEGDMPEDDDAEVDGGDMPVGRDPRPISTAGYDPRTETRRSRAGASCWWLEKQVEGESRATARRSRSSSRKHGMEQEDVPGDRRRGAE